MPAERARRGVSLAFALLSLSVIGAGLALRAPVLRTGFTVDDYAQLSMLTGAFPVERTPFELFTFSDGSAHEVAALREAGFFPWWSHPGLRVALFRPLSSALMWCDLRLFGADAFAYHLHGACWWVAMMALLAAVLRRVLPPVPAVLALAICAAHPGHIMFLGWIANRNAVVAATFALLGLWLHLAPGAERRGVRAVIAGSYVLSVCASEYALAFLPYAALCDVVKGDATRRPARRLAPWLLLLSSYAVLRMLGGLGARGSGMYIDPISEPFSYLRAALVRLPVLIGDLVLAVRSTWWSAGFPWAPQLAQRGWLPAAWAVDLRPLRSVQVAVGVIAAPILLGFVVWALRRRETGSRTRLLALGLPFALLPAVSAFPESRLLLPALLAWSALLMAAAHAAWVAVERDRRRFSAWLALASTGALGLLAVALPIFYCRDEIRSMAPFAEAVRASILSPSLDGVLGRSRRTLLLSAVDPTTTIYVPLVRRFHGVPAPASAQLLMSTASVLRLSRVASNAIALERLQSDYSAHDVYASAFNEKPLTRGERFVSDGMQVTVERVLDGRPMSARYDLDTSLDDPTVVMLIETLFGLQIVPPPPVGASVVIGPAMPPLALMRPAPSAPR